MTSFTDVRKSVATSPGSDHGASDETVPRSIARVLDVLETVVACDGVSLTSTAESNQLTPTTALRYLRALEARGYVQRDDSGEYRAGVSLLEIASKLRSTDPTQALIDRYQPSLDRLAATTGETAYLAVVTDDETATYVATAESSQAIRHAVGVGSSVPLAGTALGSALGHPGSPTAARNSVEPDVVAVSMAISKHAAISIVGPNSRIDDARITAIADALLDELGSGAS